MTKLESEIAEEIENAEYSEADTKQTAKLIIHTETSYRLQYIE